MCCVHPAFGVRRSMFDVRCSLLPPKMSLAPVKEFVLTLEGVNKTFDGFKAISELNFYMDEGELRVVIGPKARCWISSPAAPGPTRARSSSDPTPTSRS
jgi:hypothetical protein